MNRRNWLPSLLLLLAVVATGAGLVAWKRHTRNQDAAAAQNQPEPAEAVSLAIAEKREFRQATTSIGTVRALRSVTLRNEIPGTIREVNLSPGILVEPGQVLVALDVAVEEAELAALKASAALAEANLRRKERLVNSGAETAAEMERAVAERDVALAQIERVKATIARKTIRAPFRARVGLSDVHPGQFLESGAVLTTLQGVDEAVHVDFEVAQHVASELRPGDEVEVSLQNGGARAPARIVAVDARVDSTTRNAAVRARVEQGPLALTPGGSARVRVSHGTARNAVAIPASAIRRGPAGDHVYLIKKLGDGVTRVQSRKVQSGPANGDEILILSGITEGERVAASGSFKLRDDALVTIVDQPALAIGGSH
jgi:membrane fusion protein, multidrug efflux system